MFPPNAHDLAIAIRRLEIVLQSSQSGDPQRSK
jgi:hypothetical protein